MRKSVGKQAGQAALETALVFLFLIPMILGTLDIGNYFRVKVALNNAAQQAAYYLAYNPGEVDCTSGTCSPGSDGNLTNVVANNTSTLDKSNNNNVTITIQDCSISPCPAGNPVTVKLSYNFKPIVTQLIKGTLNMNSSVTMMVMQ